MKMDTFWYELWFGNPPTIGPYVFSAKDKPMLIIDEPISLALAKQIAEAFYASNYELLPIEPWEAHDLTLSKEA